jgi:hypothetical protein
MKALKLGQIIKDEITGIKGMLTILVVDIDKNVHYFFQPSQLNPETEEPVDRYWVTESRFKNPEFVEYDLPLQVLNTQVEDLATGYKGTAITLYHYLNGCDHFEVKSKGTLKKTGASVKAQEFDIRRLKGDAIPKLTEKELTESQKSKPSPESHTVLFQH